MENLKKTVASALKSMPYSLVIDGKMYSGDELADHVMKETELGLKVIEMVVKGTLERYGRKGGRK